MREEFYLSSRFTETSTYYSRGEIIGMSPLPPYKTARKDKLVSHKKVHTKASSDQSLNRERKNETKTQLSSKPKETQQPSNLKRKSHIKTQLGLLNIQDRKTLMIQSIMNNF